MDALKLSGAALLAIFAGVMWYAFLRPVKEETATGTITAKIYKPEGTTTIQQTGANRGFRSPTVVPVADAYIFQIDVSGLDKPAAIALNTILSRDFEVGQHVRVHYVHRGIPPFWRRIVITRMEPLDNP
jgi:hypothetical protein